jgi:adenylyltransferase/sulfurtransferase
MATNRIAEVSVSLPPLVEPAAELTVDEVRRYSRHLIIPEVGMDGQKRLKNAKVLCVGAGGLGSPSLMYLAAAGVGTLGIVEFDEVDESNLQRQIIHSQGDIGRSKAESARDTVRGINPYVNVILHEERLEADNVMDIFTQYDLIVDGTDNFATRYLVNDACAFLARPNVHGSVFRFEGQVSVFDARTGPCYRCLYPDPPPPGLVPSCAEGGVLGVLPGVIGVLQAIEALKLLLGIGDPLIGRLLVFDALGMDFRELRLRKDPACPLCGEHPTLTGLIDYDSWCAGASTENSTMAEPLELSVRDYQALRERGSEPLLVDVREPHEQQIAHIDGAVLIPLRTLPERIAELDRDRPIVLFCHHGSRSMRAVEYLKGQGYTRVQSLKGGIDAWSQEADPGVARY